MTRSPAEGPLAVRLGWIALVAFASGFPYGFVNDALPIYLRSEGAGLVKVGLVAAVSFPWTFKFIWSPLVDRVGTRRQWIVACLAALAALTLLVAAADVHALAPGFWFLLVAMTTLSATQDVAIDAFTIESTSEAELGAANSVRIALYRGAMFVAGGAVVWLAGRAGWRAAFTAAAAIVGGLAVAALFLPSVRRVQTADRQPIWEPVRALLRRPGIWLVIAFALIFKLDVAALEPMMRPFWVDRGLSLEEIGGALTLARTLATVGGAVIGGVLTTRWGIRRALWALGAVQACSALGYWAAATFFAGQAAVFGAAIFENFAAGLATAAYLAYLMSLCERRFAATQFALLSALLAVTRSVAGAASGTLAEHLGYSTYFLITFLVGLPAFLLIPFLSRVARPPEPAAG
ncbi:MAG TPA: MFS transporter [Gemmatimonadales bacterium]|nr:MFS transporter [Gemmatimonadales bacterium]